MTLRNPATPDSVNPDPPTPDAPDSPMKDTQT